ncbi:MAG: tail fiber domain-containing protein [Bacteroidales bacterium]|nr:tail fiber domain-containing protein [Bacteroidales bacterium]
MIAISCIKRFFPYISGIIFTFALLLLMIIDMKNLFLLLILLAVSGITFAQLRLDDQGKTILGNYNASTLECRGGAIFSRWNAEWCKIHLDWTTNGAAHLYCTSENFTVGAYDYYVGVGYFRYMQLQHSPSITSDARLKENIRSIESALDKLMLVNGKSFNYIDNFSDSLKITALRERNRRTTYGFIAQELKEVLPEVVNEPDELNEYYSVDYTAIIPLLVEAIKEQQNQITELRKQIEILSKEKDKRRK